MQTKTNEKKDLKKKGIGLINQREIVIFQKRVLALIFCFTFMQHIADFSHKNLR